MNKIAYPSTYPLDFQYGSAPNDLSDQLNRLSRLATGATANVPLMNYRYSGAGRTMYRGWGYSSNPEAKVNLATTGTLDPFGRVKQLHFTNPNNGTLQEFKYGYDENGNRNFSYVNQKGHLNQRSWIYGYDRLNRLTYAEFGKIAINGQTATFNPTVEPKGQAWNMDVLGNWKGIPGAAGFTKYTAGAPYTAVGFNDEDDSPDYTETHIADSKNRITKTTIDADGDDPGSAVNKDMAYDAAGNIVHDSYYIYVYDAWNRVVAAYAPTALTIGSKGALSGTLSDDTPLTQYKFDALSRKIAKTTDGATQPNHFYYHDGHRILEEYQVSGQSQQSAAPADGTRLTLASQLYFPQLHRRYVYGGDYIDELVTQFNVTGTTEKEYRVLQDLNWDVVALVDPQQIGLAYEIAEQYAHEPYGVRFAIENGAGTPIPGFPAFYVPLTDRSRNGLETDPVTKNIENRIRMLNTRMMRMNQRDSNETALQVASVMAHNAQTQSIGVNLLGDAQYADGLSPYSYVQSNPNSFMDPTGLTSAFLPDANWSAILGDAEEGIRDAYDAQDVLWDQDWGDDDYAAAILDYVGNRESALGTLGDAYDKATQGFGQSRLYAKAAALWTQVFFDYLAPESDIIDIDLSAMIDMMELTACFAAGTPVTLTDSSTIPIEQILPGSDVLSRDHQGDPDSPPIAGTVSHVSSREVEGYLEIEAGSETLLVTHDHPFWGVGIGWVAASELQPGSKIDSAGGTVTVSSVTTHNGALRVYNLEVADTHTYFVGTQRVWVHNNCVWQIHHIIPRQLRDHPLLKSVGFKMDSPTNLVDLKKTIHRGPHEKYTMEYIKPQLDDIYKNVKGQSERIRALKLVQNRARKLVKQMATSGIRIYKIGRAGLPKRLRLK